ncbi:MAG: D-alanyl-D-alanine carboxypeptidase, partial [Prevotellaceae bacterium]|nr:D-alanyl-D-alanine carboxypeptidase [Prevotellaceae bacterium]
GLHLLGCDYHYWTAIFLRGNVASDGTLKGDLAFKAGLDPQLLAPDLVEFAKVVRKKGVKRVGGKVYVDLTINEPVKSEEHWYPWDLTFSKYGLFYKGSDKVVKALKASLRGNGIAVADSQIVFKPTTRDFRCLYVSRRQIGEVIKRMWKNSSNTQATAMLYTIGNKVNPKDDPVTSGVDYLRKFLVEKLALTDSSLVVHDGCGLCTHNRLSPIALTSVLRFGYEDPRIRKMLEQHLAVAGVDGTLAREMTGGLTRGKIKAKTGTLSHPYGISSLAGLCEGANGHVLAFAIMDSEMSVLDARVLQRRLCEALVRPAKDKK